jgi:protein-disulfide isomerase
MDCKTRPSQMRLPRRAVFSGLGLALAGVAALALSSQSGFTQGAKPTEVPVDELMKQTTDLPDLVMGSPDAKVTIVEYASMTCGHCQQFHTKVLPDLKTKYIDTGKVKLVFREFPLDPRAFAASMLARCAGGDKSFPLVGALFDTQADWAFVKENPKPKLFEVAKQAGFTQESFDKCLTDQKLLDQLSAVRARASDVFGVSATPTFFINGKRHVTAPTVEEFEKTLQPLVGG